MTAPLSMLTTKFEIKHPETLLNGARGEIVLPNRKKQQNKNSAWLCKGVKFPHA